ncbi:MAG: hypothetical protein ABFD49_05790 [Armatimonadota bacterium]|nr:hypothetical protein [bacterium]
MRTALSTLVILLFVTSIAAAGGNVNLNANDIPIKEAVAQISQQTGALIVLDPKATGSVTVNLSEADLPNVLDVITKLNKLTWKKLQFAKQSDSTIKLDQLKSAILALSSIPVAGLSVEDPESKTTAVFAKDLLQSPETSNLHLPDGYTWTTIYVILVPEVETADKDKKSTAAELAENEAKNTFELADMTPEERQQVYASMMNAYMNLTTEQRQAMMADQMRAVFNSDYSQDYMHDMFSVMQTLRSSGEMPDMGPGRGGPDKD